MVRWWNVIDVTPSGLTLNRTWKLRQILSALVTPAFAWILLESVSRWEKRRLERLDSAGKERSQEQPLPIPDISITDIASQYFMSHAPESISKVAIEYYGIYSRVLVDFRQECRTVLIGKIDASEDSLFIVTFRKVIAKINESWKNNAIKNDSDNVNTTAEILPEPELQSSIRKRRNERDGAVTTHSPMTPKDNK